MKLQHLAIIFVIIIIPISVVLSAYIQNQIDLIEIQTAYDNILINSTYDAVKAFQLNTTNNKYSTISDSKIRDIEAAVSTFYNSLNTSMTKYGMSPTDLEVYTPALLFTLYDGYYIYSSYNNVYSWDDEKKASINLDGKNFENGLKPYVYYSAKYKLKNENVIVVNYTLDNEITVYGDFGDGYETKSGYLIDTGKVKNIDETNKTLIYDNDIIIQKEQLQEHLITIENSATGETKEGDYIYIFYQNKKVYLDPKDPIYSDGSYKIFWYDNYTKTYIQDAQTKKYAQECQMYSTSAYDYYKEAYEFSMWVQDKLKDVKQNNMLKIEKPDEFITQNNAEGEFYLSENTGDENIFEFSDTNDPMLSDSTFNNHRLAVIRKSIETNLNAVISSYQNTALYEYEMPIMSSQDWYKILNNVSVVSYMQGMPIGGYRYYFDPDTNIMARNTMIDGIYLGSDGKASEAYTYASAILNQVGWSLRAAYDWCIGLKYIHMTEDPSPGSEWFALYGYKNGRGNCYVMAGTFYCMAKLMGYDAHQISGYVMSVGGNSPHSWVEINIGGTIYVFDVSFENGNRGDGYYFTYGTPGTWRYTDYYRMN